MRFDRVFLTVFNLLARLFGVVAILAGIIFLVRAYAIRINRLLDIVVGLILVVIGIAFFVTKLINADQLARIRRWIKRHGSRQ